MSHLHLPDGILPVWLWLLGYVIVSIYIMFTVFYLKKHSLDKRIPLVGVIAALMLITMSIEIIPPAYHMNLAVLAGIVLGPIFSVLAILTDNIILAFLGHGGVTVIGLNTITVSIEAILGYWLFKLLYPAIKNIFVSVFITTVIALFISAWGAVGVIYLGTRNTSEFLFEHHHGAEVHAMHEESQVPVELDLKKLILAVLTLGLPGWIIEGIITAFILSYMSKIKPDLIEKS